MAAQEPTGLLAPDGAVAHAPKRCAAREERHHDEGEERARHQAVDEGDACVSPPARARLEAAATSDREDAERGQDDDVEEQRRQDARDRPECHEGDVEAEHAHAEGDRGAHLLGRDAHAAHEVAGARRVGARVALALEADLVPVVGARGDLDDDLAGGEDATGAAAALAGVRDDLARALALGAAHLDHAEAEDAGEVDVDVAGAAAGRAGLGMLGLDRAVPRAGLAGDVALVRDPTLGAALGGLVVERELVDDVGARARVVRAGARARLRLTRPAEGEAPAEGRARARRACNRLCKRVCKNISFRFDKCKRRKLCSRSYLL